MLHPTPTPLWRARWPFARHFHSLEPRTTSAVLLALHCTPVERAEPPLEGVLSVQTGDVDVPAGAAVAVGDGYHVIGTIRPSRNACIAFDPRSDTTTGQYAAGVCDPHSGMKVHPGRHQTTLARAASIPDRIVVAPRF